MEFTRSHVRQRILTAVEAAVKTVPDVSEVTVAAPFGDHPRKGTLIDIAFLEEDNIVKDGGAPGRLASGVMKRPLAIGLRVKAQVPLDMTAIKFEGLLGDVERAMVSIPDAEDLVDDIVLNSTVWAYGQDGRTSEVSALLVYIVNYKTPAADPGKSY